jgi:hypothetical protein
MVKNLPPFEELESSMPPGPHFRCGSGNRFGRVLRDHEANDEMADDGGEKASHQRQHQYLAHVVSPARWQSCFPLIRQSLEKSTGVVWRYRPNVTANG